MSADVMLHTPPSTIHHKHPEPSRTFSPEAAPFPHSAAQQVPVRRAKAARNAPCPLFFF